MQSLHQVGAQVQAPARQVRYLSQVQQAVRYITEIVTFLLTAIVLTAARGSSSN